MKGAALENHVTILPLSASPVLNEWTKNGDASNSPRLKHGVIAKNSVNGRPKYGDNSMHVIERPQNGACCPAHITTYDDDDDDMAMTSLALQRATDGVISNNFFSKYD